MEPDRFAPRLARPSLAGIIPLGAWRPVESEASFRASLPVFVRSIAFMETASGPSPAPSPPPAPTQARMTLRELRATLREDKRAAGDPTLPGVRALRVHRMGNYAHGLPSGIRRRVATRLYTAAFRRVRDKYGIEIPHTVRLGRRVVIDHQNGIIVNGASVIGDDCVLRQGVTLGTKRRSDHAAAPVLGARVDVGAGAKILGRVHVGDGAKIGANAVVVSDVPAGAVVAGVPARIIRMPEALEDAALFAHALPEIPLAHAALP